MIPDLAKGATFCCNSWLVGRASLRVDGVSPDVGRGTVSCVGLLMTTRDRSEGPLYECIALRVLSNNRVLVCGREAVDRKVDRSMPVDGGDGRDLQDETLISRRLGVRQRARRTLTPQRPCSAKKATDTGKKASGSAPGHENSIDPDLESWSMLGICQSSACVLGLTT